MKKLTNKQLKDTYGGISVWAILGAIAAFIFGVGAIDGYTRPYKCRK